MFKQYTAKEALKVEFYWMMSYEVQFMRLAKTETVNP